MSYLSFSRRWAGYLAARTGVSREQEVVLAYIIELLTLNLLNVGLTLGLGWLAGVLPGTAACLVAVALFRHTAGGAHSASPWRCALVTVTVFPAMARLAAFITSNGGPYMDIILIASVLTGLAAILMLAPVDSPAAPIISATRRKKLKFSALLVLAILVSVMVYFRGDGGAHADEVPLCLAFSILWVSFILSKPGHRAMAFIDNISLSGGRR